MVKHPVILRGYQAAINDRTAQPVIVQRLDQEFIPGLLDGLRRKLSPNELGRVENGSGSIRLFQPIHRAFNLVLLEAVCDRPGSPRLNPLDIASAGFVVRRGQAGGDQGWMLRDEQVVGWTRPMEADLDPDPAQRKPRLNTGNAHINGKLARLHAALEPPAERISHLFVAPPEICATAGRTLLYGLIPVTSAERSEETQSVAIDSDIVRQTMPGFLAGPGFNTWPDLRDAPLDLNTVNQTIGTDAKASISRLMQDLRLMHFGWHAFDPIDGVAILPLLNKVTLKFSDGRTEALGTFLEQLVHRFVARDDGSEASIVMPTDWPQPDEATAADLRTAVGLSLQARLAESVPNEQRFDDTTAFYRIHAFIRVRCVDDCPPVLQWAPPSAPFQIVPWWESGAGPLHTISLPDFDRESIKKVKPNISFKVPPRLAALLTQKPDDLLNGKGDDPGSGLTLGWICSFSIPIITLCAFIVLNIFLALLHIVFWWLFYIKICLPFPKPQSSQS